MKQQDKIKKNIPLFIIAALVLGISSAHYLTPVGHHQWHEIFRRLYFIPILMAAIYYGFRSGMTVAVLITLIYLPHVIFQWSGSFSVNLVRFNEIILYLLLGGLSGFLSDTTRKERDRFKKTADELEQAYLKLKEQSNQMAELEYQLKSADRLAVLGELTASLAHEVRNPLGSIRGAAEILRKRCRQDDTSQEFTKVLMAEVDRLNQVVDRYLSMTPASLSSSGSSELKAALDSVIYMLGPQFRKKQISLETDWPADRVIIPLTEVEVRQIFLNLMLNSLAVLNSKSRIKIQTEMDDSEVIIRFSDNGPGIPEAKIKMIFTPFFTTKKQGSGLGLAIVKRIIESKKGKISVQSRPGEETTFTICLPRENHENRKKYSSDR
jgi:two-component system sensor histidine kinase HydH